MSIKKVSFYCSNNIEIECNYDVLQHFHMFRQMIESKKLFINLKKRINNLY